MAIGETLAVSALATAAAFVGALSGFGFALLVVPPLSLIVGPKEAVVLANGLGPVQSLAMLVHLRRFVAWPAVGRLFVAACAGMPFGFLLLTAVSAGPLRAVIAVTVICATLALWRGLRIPWAGLFADGLTGFISGVLNTSTSMNGPPVVLYFQGQGIEPNHFRGTLSAFFVASSVIAVGMFIAGGQLAGDDALQIGACIPAVLAGWWAGNRLFARLDHDRFRQVVLSVLLASASIVLVSAAAG